MLAELMLLRKLQRFVNGAIGTAITHNEDLPSFLTLLTLPTSMRIAILTLQIVNGLFQHALQALFLVVCGYHDAHEQLWFLNRHLGWYDNLASWLFRCFFLRCLLLCRPFIQPTRKFLWMASCAVG